MKKRPESRKSTALRSQAEGFLNKTSSDIRKIPPRDIKNLIEELQIHQIELEMQNEELRRTQQELQEAQEIYRNIISESPVGISIYDASGQCLEANDSIAKIIGTTREQVLQQNYNSIESWKQSGFLDKAKRAVEDQSIKRHDLVVESTFGKGVKLDSYLVPFSSGGLLLMVNDITDRLKAEDALRESEEKFRLLTEQNLLGIIIIQDGFVKYVNKTASGITEYSIEEVLDWKPNEFGKLFHPDDLGFVMEQAQKKQEGAKDVVTHYSYRMLTKSREVRWIDQYSKTISFAGKTADLITIIDITESKQAKEALQQKTQDLGERVKELNCLYSISGLVEKPDISLDEIFQGVVDIIPLAFQYPEVTCSRISLNGKEWKTENFKETGWKQTNGIFVLGQLAGSLEVCYLEEKPEIDEGPFLKEERNLINAIAEQLGRIVESMQAKEALRESEERARTLLDAITEIVTLIDTEGTVLASNEVAARRLGLTVDELEGRNLFDQFPPGAAKPRKEAIDKVIQTGKAVRVDIDDNGRILDSHCYPLLDGQGKVIQVAVFAVDVTDRQKLHEEHLKLEKFESLGILAGGIAHDFNNILTTIMGNLSYAKMGKDRDSETHEVLEEAEKASFRAKNLTQQLLTFAKGGAPVRETASLPEVIGESARFATKGSNVRCDFAISEGIWPAEIDVGQISQVTQNLIINADQAMPEGGVIKIEMDNRVVEAKDVLPLLSGKYIQVSIRDQGAGIPEKHLPKIFDPYFSTKDKGTGLGLATALSIIKKHGGHITVDSELGAGTVFHIYLAASEREMAEAKAMEGEPIKGHGKIMIMDDEEPIRNLGFQVFNRLGYEVALASDGDEAVSLFGKAKKAGEPFDAVILDLTIPGGRGGKETINLLKEIDPNVKAIIASGYSNDPVMGNFRDYGFRGVVTKPFKVEKLSQILHDVLTRTNK